MKFEETEATAFWARSAVTARTQDELTRNFVGMLPDGNLYHARRREAEEFSRFARMIALNSNMSILEVGTGSGRWAFHLAPKVHRVVAIDIIPEMIDICLERNVKCQSRNIQFLCQHFLQMPKEPEFDLIYFSGVLQYLDDVELKKYIEMARRLLKGGGRIISRDTVRSGLRQVLTGSYPVIYRTDEEYRSLFKAAGFEMYCAGEAYTKRPLTTIMGKLQRIFGISDSWTSFYHDKILSIFAFLRLSQILEKPNFKREARKYGSISHNFFFYRQT